MGSDRRAIRGGGRVSAPAAADAAPPQDREEILARVGEPQSKIYVLVRTILDDLEAVAPWERLYYPPADTAEFLDMETALVGMIEDIPKRVDALAGELTGAAPDGDVHDLVDNLEFYFQSIQVSIASELDKLKSKVDGLRAEAADLSAEERTFTCEISADLKGKLTSSIMGAAAGLVAEGMWNGVEIEPVLFPEKAEEFERNERLVEALSAVTEDIGRFLELVPLVDLVASWQKGLRVDQYALSPLYTLLGDLGNLMQISSRRALYSGDYQQIRRREGHLSTRINELMTLHNTTWGRVPESVRTDDVALYPLMVRKARELAAILDVEILKQLVGDSTVKDLYVVVTIEKEDSGAGRLATDERQLARRSRIPAELHSLIPLLSDEDLKTFLELLLGSVLKRASLTVQRESAEPAPVAPAAEEGAAAELLPSIELPAMAAADPPAELLPPIAEPPAAEPAPEPAGDPDAERLEGLERLLAVLQPLLSRSSPHRKSFELVRRLLKQGRTIPAGLLESMRPYLYEVMNQLVPQLRDDSRLGDMYLSYGSGLFEHCRVLCDPRLSPESRTVDVPETMERVLDLLNRLAIAARSSVERLSEGSEARG